MWEHIFIHSRKQKVVWDYKLPKENSFLQQSSITYKFSNLSNWGPSIQISKSVLNISHLDHQNTLPKGIVSVLAIWLSLLIHSNILYYFTKMLHWLESLAVFIKLFWIDCKILWNALVKCSDYWIVLKEQFRCIQQRQIHNHNKGVHAHDY